VFRIIKRDGVPLAHDGRPGTRQPIHAPTTLHPQWRRQGHEETLSALTGLQRAGKIRAFGASTFPAYRIVQAQWAAREHHLRSYVTEQPSYSILQRGIETHVLPVTEQVGLKGLWRLVGHGRGRLVDRDR
jgi:aryl-alcohol dehydrogenase-like predicted oxidoreductase